MILVELIPRSIESLVAEARNLQALFPFIDGFNIPDVKRLSVRSHDAAIALQSVGINAIPHIRCMDRPLEQTIEIASHLVKSGIKGVLVVSGDVQKSGPAHMVSPLEVIAGIKQTVSGLTVYAGTDPYRTSLQTELRYCRKKQEAGADGFFSQPFFDAAFASYFRSLVGESDFFTGITPVLSHANRTYWETVNSVVFPSQFDITMDQSVAVGRDLIDASKGAKQHIYVMPIKADAVTYIDLMFR